MRVCLTCNTLHDGRCPHTHHPKPSPSRRGYGPDWQRRSRAAIQAEPWCHNPNGCPHRDAGTPANPLTGDHPIPLAAGGSTTQDPVPLCRRCNSAKRDRLT